MKIRTLSCVLTLLAGLSACAGMTGMKSQASQSAASEEEQQVAAATADPSRLICKSVVKTGTRIGSRECRTNREWIQAQEDARAATELIQRESAQTKTMIGN
jgi:hypothetical protein